LRSISGFILLAAGLPFLRRQAERVTEPFSPGETQIERRHQNSESTNQTSTEKTGRDALIVEHLPLVTAIAAHGQKSIPVHTELDDLMNAGMMGLFDAATQFQNDKQVAFPFSLRLGSMRKTYSGISPKFSCRRKTKS
jgi:DNA-directed RNA polymerase sigma subunit (sigma70/sigma32)